MLQLAMLQLQSWLYPPPAPPPEPVLSIGMSILEGFGNVSLWLAVTPILIGLAFMSGGRDALADDFANLPKLKGQSCTGEVGAWMVHLIYFGGMCCWGWAITTLGLALQYEAPLAVAAGFIAWDSGFLYMLFTGSSPMGFPGFYGPPLPLQILFGVASASSITSVALKIMAGAVAPSYFLVLAIGITGPHALGAKARAVPDWKAKMPPGK